MTDHLNNPRDGVGEKLEHIVNQRSLREINSILTRSMASQRIQHLIRDDNLNEICKAIIETALKEQSRNKKAKILAVAMLARLSAVARNRDDTIYEKLDYLLDSKPASLWELSDGDEKYYAAVGLSKSKAPWLVQYSVDQLIVIGVPGKALSVLVDIVLEQSGNLSDFWKITADAFKSLNKIHSNATRYRHIYRITQACSTSVNQWAGEVGENAGKMLSEWFRKLTISNKSDVDPEVLSSIFDESTSMLLRIVELRFSNALSADTYSMLERVRASYGAGIWTSVVRSSSNIERIRTVLKEAALVLARQGRTDVDVMKMLASAYYSRSQVGAAIKAHFKNAHELEPEIRTWWEQAGKVTTSERKFEHHIGNTEDSQIGALLLNIEENKNVMERLERSVVPFLEIADPPLSETVRRASAIYSEVSQSVRQLANMRRLTRMEMKGQTTEYNPIQQDLLGGHKLGVRRVKVVRDGVQKNFGGKIKTLVKPRVTAIE